MPIDAGVLLLGGPTASGKSELAIALAQRYDAEIVGADSRQIYRDMPIGTVAPTAEQRARVPHHLVGFIDPFERYSAARYVADAAAAIASIHARGKHALVVGGTGFYLRALAGDVDLAAEPDAAIRARVRGELETHPLDVLHDWLRTRDPQRAAAISVRDPYRIARALEIVLLRVAGRIDPGRSRGLPTLRSSGVRFAKIVVRIDAAVLAGRVDGRTDAMLAAGLVDEAERIGSAAVAADAVGYREALAYARGWLTREELRTVLARATRRYAKRQQTWFRTEPGVDFIEPGDIDAASRVAESLGWDKGPFNAREDIRMPHA